MASAPFDLGPSPEDAISSLKFSSSSSKLLVSCWDKHVYLYDAQGEPDNQLTRKFEHRAPVLDVCFGDDDNDAYSGGLDNDVRRIDLTTGDQTVLSTHEEPVKSVVYSPKHHVLISASWDKTLHIHHIAQPTLTPATLNIPEKPFALAISPTKLIVAMANRLVHIYDLHALTTFSESASQTPPNIIDVAPFQVRESSLKFMTRAVACMPNDEGYATSSIEGRVAVEWYDAGEESQARKYAFKCHRQTQSDPDDPEAPASDIIYPVHALAFHPKMNTFVSGGGDGFVAVWDANAKRRIRQYAKYATSVAAAAYSYDGALLAVAVSPGFEDGNEEAIGEGPYRISVRAIGEADLKSKK